MYLPYQIAQKFEYLNNTKTTIKNAIKSYGISVSDSLPFRNYAEKIQKIKEKDVNFYDYDGSLLYSYSKDEFLALSEMPANPTHSGLTSQGWNYSLQNAQSYVTNYKYLDIGQNYTTTDGSSKYYINTSNYSNIELNFEIKLNGEVIIDWGDNTTPVTLTGNDITSVINATHTYINGGEYIIKITPNTILTMMSLIADAFNNSGDRSNSYFINKIEVGNHVSDISGSSNSTSTKMNSIKSITLPNSITSITNIINANVLKCLILPDGLLGFPIIKECYNLTTICMGNGLTSCDTSDNSLWNLKSLTLPTSVNTFSIGNTNQVAKALKRIVIPTSVTNGNLLLSYSPIEYFYGKGGTYRINLNYARALKELIFDDNEDITLLGTSGNPLQGTLSLEKIKFPKSVTTYNFSYLGYNLKELDMTNYDEVPTTSSTFINQLQTQAKQCKILVPASLYNAFINSSYWSSVANRIVSVS